MSIIVIVAVFIIFIIVGVSVYQTKTRRSIQHLEMFVRNKIREGYQGDNPSESAKENVMNRWVEYGNIGANAQAASTLGSEDEVSSIVSNIADAILRSEDELNKTLRGEYAGSQEHLLEMIRED